MKRTLNEHLRRAGHKVKPGKRYEPTVEEWDDERREDPDETELPEGLRLRD